MPPPAEPCPSPPYAVVVVRTELTRQVTSADQMVGAEDKEHLSRAFHYRVPDRLREQIALGHLVWVPFGHRCLQGIVIGFDDRSPVEKTRDIDQIVDPEPVLDPLLLQLAEWICSHYLAPLQRVLDAMLPPGVTQDMDTVASACVETTPKDATPAEAALLDLLRAEGPLANREIATRTTVRSWQAVVNRLVTRGWVERMVRLRPPAARPKMVQVVRLAPGVGPDALPDGRAAARRRAFEHLLARADDEWLAVADAAAEAGVGTPTYRALSERGLVLLSEREVWRDPLKGRAFVATAPLRLTSEQAQVWDAMRLDLDAPAGKPFLLLGVTGSGKTEIYLQAVRHVLNQGRSAIVLVPEIALTPQTVRRFGARFPSTLAVMHSRLSNGERYDQWRRMRAGELRVVVGSRSAIFAPVRDLGLVVVDEEHEWSYKQRATPRYHARDVAVRLAQLAGATCVLGSATPSLESAYLAERGTYRLLAMPRRVLGHLQEVTAQAARLRPERQRFRPTEGEGGPEPDGQALYTDLPPVEVVDMRAELRAGHAGIFSRRLLRDMDAALAVEEQVILFLNRRGWSSFVLCRDCGHVPRCRRCQLPLTYHSHNEALLICHHCNAHEPPPERCPACESTRIRHFGVGTQRVEAEVRRRYPLATVVRWDLDTTGGKDAHDEILDRFVSGEADIMVGTQMIAKGLDLPKVTLVGVVAADTVLNLPDFRSAERTFQLLTQVAGRAGRSVLGGRVVVQTYMPHHPAILAAACHDYEVFYQSEMRFRREFWYPPLSTILRLEMVAQSQTHAEDECRALYRLLEDRIAQLGLPEVDLIGPAPAFFMRERGKYRWQILVRGKDPAALVRDLRLPLGWRVDVEPASLL